MSVFWGFFNRFDLSYHLKFLLTAETARYNPESNNYHGGRSWEVWKWFITSRKNVWNQSLEGSPPLLRALHFVPVLRAHMILVPNYANFSYPNAYSLCFDYLFIEDVKTLRSDKNEPRSGYSSYRTLKMSLCSTELLKRKDIRIAEIFLAVVKS